MALWRVLKKQKKKGNEYAADELAESDILKKDLLIRKLRNFTGPSQQ